MDTQEHTYKYEKEPEGLMRLDALRYRRLKFFLDTLVIMDKDKGALHFDNGIDLDRYIESLTISTKLITPQNITAHALNILENQLKMTSEENRK